MFHKCILNDKSMYCISLSFGQMWRQQSYCLTSQLLSLWRQRDTNGLDSFVRYPPSRLQRDVRNISLNVNERKPMEWPIFLGFRRHDSDCGEESFKIPDRKSRIDEPKKFHSANSRRGQRDEGQSSNDGQQPEHKILRRKFSLKYYVTW